MTNNFLPIGYKTLQTINNAKRFNQWMYKTIKPFIYGKVLEVGSGIGNLSELLLKDGFELTLSDYETQYLSILKQKFFSSPSVKKILSIDLAHPDFTKEYHILRDSFDTILLLNVLEHIQDDASAMRNCHYLLKKNGCLITLVPAYSFLYSKFDKELGHYRRYNKKRLKKILAPLDYSVKNCFYFNALGIAGWLVNKLLQQGEISETKMKLFDIIVPIGKALDFILLKQMGLSVILIAQKKPT